MFYGKLPTFDYELFKELLKNEDYDTLIYNCYYSPNQEDIILFLEKHLHSNNVILNYIYVRNSFQLGKFSDPDIVRKCLSIAFRTIFIVVSHINICSEINRKFEILDILVKKYDEKFKNIVTLDIFDFAINHSKKDVLQFIDTMSSNISLVSPLIQNDKKKMLDLPEPHFICNVTAGSWRYPAIKYNKCDEETEKINSEKFIKNYSGRCQKYYDAYQYVSDKLKFCRDDFANNKIFNLGKFFL